MKLFLALLFALSIQSCCNCSCDRDHTAKTRENKTVEPAWTITLDTNHRERKWNIRVRTQKGSDTIETAIPIGAGCTLNTHQLDGKGLPEAFLQYNTFGGGTTIGNATDWMFGQSSTVHEIWDLEKKQKVFSATSFYQYEIASRGSGGIKSGWHKIDSCFYRYEFSVNDKAQIVLHDLVAKNMREERVKQQCNTPDHAPGIYQYKNGEVVKIQVP